MAKKYTATVVLDGDPSGAVESIKLTKSQLERLTKTQDNNSEKTEKQAGKYKALGIALGVMASTGLVRVATKTLDTADNIQKLNLRIGASTEALSEYRHVAELSGVSFETLVNSWGVQSKALSEASQGLGRARNALKLLGVDVSALKEMKPEDAFESLAEALNKVPSVADRTAIAMRIWGESGRDLTSITSQGTEAIHAMRKEAVKLGLSLSQDQADAAARANDAMTTFSASLTGLAQTLTLELAPGLSGTLEFINDLILADDPFDRFGISVGNLVDELSGLADKNRALEFESDPVNVYNKKIIDLTDAIFDYQDAIKSLDVSTEAGIATYKAYARNIESLSDKVDKLRSKHKEVNKDIGANAKKTSEAEKLLTIQTKEYIEAQKKAKKAEDDRKKALDKIIDSVDSAGKAQREYNESIDNLMASLDAGDISLERYIELTEQLGGIKYSEEEIKKTREDIDDLVKSIDSAGHAQYEYNKTIDDLMYALDTGRISIERYLELTEMLGGVHYNASTEASNGWVEMAEIMDDSMSESFSSIVDNGTKSFDSIVDEYKKSIAEMIQYASDHKEELDFSPEGMSAAWDKYGDTVATSVIGAATAKWAENTGSGAAEGAATGAQYGSTFGVWGAVIGAVLGAAFGGIGNTVRATYANVSDSSAPPQSDRGVTYSSGSPWEDNVTSTGAFGTLGLANAGSTNVDVDNLRDALQGITLLDDTIADTFGPQSTARIRDALDGWYEVDNQANDFAGAMRNRFEIIMEHLDFAFTNLVLSDDGSIDVLAQKLFELKDIMSFIESDPLEDYAERTRIANQTLREAYMEQGEELRSLISIYDGSVEATSELQRATQQRYESEIQYLQQIASVQESITSSMQGAIERINLSVMDTEGQYDYLTDKAESLAASINTLTDPEMIRDVTDRIRTLTEQAYGLVGDEQRPEVSTEFTEFLSGVTDAANERLEAERAGAEARSNQMRDALYDAIVSAGERLQSAGSAAGSSLSSGANAINEAAHNFLGVLDHANHEVD